MYLYIPSGSVACARPAVGPPTRLRRSSSQREREREIHYVHSASLAYEDGVVFMSDMSLSLLQQGNETMADRLLVLVPHEQTHAPRSILEQARKLGPNVTEMRAIKQTMEFIAQSLCITNGAPAKVARDGRPG